MGRCAMRVGWAVPVGILVLGCAQGADAEGENFGFNPPTGADATGGDDGPSSSSSEGGEGKEDSGDDGIADSSDSGPPATDTGMVADTGGSESSTGEPMGSTGADDGGSITCSHDVNCGGAESIGGVAGDESTPSLVISGDDPRWVTFQVSENNNDVIGETLSFTASLVSPMGVDFDLYVTRGPEGGSSGCVGSSQQSTNAGVQDSVHMEWGEGAFANNVDDGSWIAVEVRPKNGMCEPGAEWTLTVQGDT